MPTSVRPVTAPSRASAAAPTVSQRLTTRPLLQCARTRAVSSRALADMLLAVWVGVEQQKTRNADADADVICDMR
jgi:hypothetical protein